MVSQWNTGHKMRDVVSMTVKGSFGHPLYRYYSELLSFAENRVPCADYGRAKIAMTLIGVIYSLQDQVKTTKKLRRILLYL